MAILWMMLGAVLTLFCYSLVVIGEDKHKDE